MSEEKENVLDFGSIDFTPAWAKKDAGVNVGRFRPVEDRDQKAGDRGDRDRGRKPFGEKRPFGDRKPFNRDGGRKPFGDRKPFDRDRKPRFEERPRPLDCEVKILPETKALGTIIRKLQGDTHAYKLKDLAYFFLDNPESILLQIKMRQPQDGGRGANGGRGEAVGRDAPIAPHFCQCKACGFASTKEEDVLSHILAAHLADYYDAKEIDCEPPKGNFNCVAKCGLTGVLLGPPNIHEFNSVVREMIRTKFPEMSEEQYRAHIEMVRDADAIEEWRKGATKKTVYFAKGQAEVEGAAQFTREQAEGEFRRTILPSLVEHPKHLMITASVALKSPVKPLVWAVNDAIQAERRAPAAMCFALRGAFHHRKMHFFRANDARGPEFVAGLEYKAFDAAHAIPELASAAQFVVDHPCCDKSEFPKDVPEFEQHLNWLVSTGHVVAFTNGVFSAVEKYPKYGPQWKKRGKKAEGRGEAAARQNPDAEPAEPAPQEPAAEPAEPARQNPAAEPAEPAPQEPAAEPVGRASHRPPQDPVEEKKEEPSKISEEEVKSNETAPVVAE